MKKILCMFVATAMMTALAVSSFAQGAGPKGGAPGQGKGPGGKQGKRNPMGMDGEILAKLNLTEDQKKSVKKLKEDTQKKFKEVMESAKGDREGAREKMKGVMEGYQNGLKKILTPAQQEQYAKEMKEMRKKFQGRRNGPGGAPGGNKPGGNN